MAATFSQFLSDPLRVEIFLVDVSPYDPALEASVALRYASDKFVTAATDSPASTAYSARATVAINAESVVYTVGTVAVAPPVTGGEIRIGQRYGDLDGLASYYWDGRPVTIRLAGYSPIYGWVSLANARTIYQGEIAASKLTTDEIVLELREQDARFSFPMQEVPLIGQQWCFRLDASNSQYGGDSTPDAKLDLQNVLTVEIRAYIESLPASNARIIGFSGGTGWPWAISLDSSGHIYLSDSAGTLWTSTATLSAKRWYQLAVAVSAASLRFELWDHAAETLTTEEDATDYTGRAAVAGSPTFYVGAGGTNFLDGYLACARVWDIKRAASELASTRNRRLTTGEETDANLIALWRMDEGTGAVIADYATTPSDLAIGGTSYSTDEPEAWALMLEGGADIGGTPRPLGYGRCESVRPVLVGMPSNIYLVSGSKASSIEGVYEGGNEIAQDSATFTDLKSFLDATTPGAKFDALTYDGGTYIRLGSTPQLVVTVDYRGDATGSGYVETAGAVARRIITTRGPAPLVDPTELDTAAFTALDAANSAPVGVHAYGSETIAALVGIVLGSVGASGYFSALDGLFTVNRFGGVTGSAAATFDERTIVSIEPVPVERPYYAVSLGYARQYTTLDEGDFAGIVLEENRPIAFRLQNEFSYARVEDLAVRDLHPRAGTYLRDTALALEVDAVAEAERILAIVKGAAEAYKLKVIASEASDVERFDIVTVSLRDRAEGNAVQQRLGLGSGTNFIVFARTPLAEDGTIELTVWRGGL